MLGRGEALRLKEWESPADVFLRPDGHPVRRASFLLAGQYAEGLREVFPSPFPKFPGARMEEEFPGPDRPDGHEGRI